MYKDFLFNDKYFVKEVLCLCFVVGKSWRNPKVLRAKDSTYIGYSTQKTPGNPENEKIYGKLRIPDPRLGPEPLKRKTKNHRTVVLLELFRGNLGIFGDQLQVGDFLIFPGIFRSGGNYA